MSVDLDDTTNCPCAEVCSWCGHADPTRQVEATESPVGVGCVTVCDDCYETATSPSMSFVEAFDSVAVHCGHLGITLDEMAALLERQRNDEMTST